MIVLPLLALANLLFWVVSSVPGKFLLSISISYILYGLWGWLTKSVFTPPHFLTVYRPQWDRGRRALDMGILLVAVGLVLFIVWVYYFKIALQ